VVSRPGFFFEFRALELFLVFGFWTAFRASGLMLGALIWSADLESQFGGFPLSSFSVRFAP